MSGLPLAPAGYGAITMLSHSGSSTAGMFHIGKIPLTTAPEAIGAPWKGGRPAVVSVGRTARRRSYMNLQGFGGRVAVESARAVFVVQFAACAPDVGDEFLRVEQTATNVHETLLGHRAVRDCAICLDECQRVSEGQRGNGRGISREVGAIEHRTRADQQRQTAHVAVVGHGVNRGRAGRLIVRSQSFR